MRFIYQGPLRSRSDIRCLLKEQYSKRGEVSTSDDSYSLLTAFGQVQADVIKKKRKHHLSQISSFSEHTCAICGKKLRSAGELRWHILQHYQVKTHTCVRCGVGFLTEGDLRVHTETHNVEELSSSSDKARTKIKSYVRSPPKDQNCKKEEDRTSDSNSSGLSTAFEQAEGDTQTNATNHLNQNTSSSEYTCLICGLKLRSVDELRRHVLQYEASLKFKTCTKTSISSEHTCWICGNKLKSICELRWHVLQHDQASPIKKTCTKSSGLAVRDREKQFSCDVCEIKFRSMYLLEVHKKLHKVERDYVCKVCGAGYSSKNRLNTHESVHTVKKENTIACKVGNATFPFKYRLNDQKMLHYRKAYFACDICRARFQTKSSLFSHKILHAIENS